MFKFRKLNGSPGKSYLHIMQLDYYFNLILSMLYTYNILDVFVLSCLEYKHRQKDRRNDLQLFIKYICTDEEKAIVFLKNSFCTRSKIIIFLKKLISEVNNYNNTKDKKFKLEFRKNYPISRTFFKLLNNCNNEINLFQNSLVKYYLRSSVKKLMLNRKGEHQPNDLNSDAYEAIILTLDKYNYTRSKVPFIKLLEFFLKNKKDSIIKRGITGVPLDEEDLKKKIVEKEVPILEKIEGFLPLLSENQRNAVMSRHNILTRVSLEETIINIKGGI